MIYFSSEVLGAYKLSQEPENIWISLRAENNPIICSTWASKQACRIISRIAISIRAPALAERGEEGRATASATGATVLSCVENSAGIVASTRSS